MEEFLLFLNGETESHTPFIKSRIQCLAHNAKQRAEGL